MRISKMISAVDTHACGEPGRVIVGGVLDIPGNSIFDKKCYLEEHADHLRKLMLREPRGYPASNCNLILPACHPDEDAGYVIMEQVEYPPMSGTNTIAVTTVLLETGMLPAKEPITELTPYFPLVPIDLISHFRNVRQAGRSRWEVGIVNPDRGRCLLDLRSSCLQRTYGFAGVCVGPTRVTRKRTLVEMRSPTRRLHITRKSITPGSNGTAERVPFSTADDTCLMPRRGRSHRFGRRYSATEKMAGKSVPTKSMP